MARGGLHGGEDAGQVDLHDLVPFRRVDSVDRACLGQVARSGADAGVGEDGVEPTATLGGSVDGGTQGGEVRHIEDDALDGGAGGGEAPGVPFQRLGIDVRHDDMGAVVGHDLGHGEAEAARRAGDEGDMAGNVEQVRRLHRRPPEAAASISGAACTAQS